MTAEFDFAAALAEIEAELADALAKLPIAKQAYTAAFHEHGLAQGRWNNFCLNLDKRLSRVGRDGDTNQIITVTGATQRLIDVERQKYRDSGAALSQARRNLADLRWRIEGLNADSEQLDLVQNPPKPPILPAEPR